MTTQHRTSWFPGKAAYHCASEYNSSTYFSTAMRRNSWNLGLLFTMLADRGNAIADSCDNLEFGNVKYFLL